MGTWVPKTPIILYDGTIYDKNTKDLIGSARFVVDFSLLNLLTDSRKYDSSINHGLDFLLDVHKDKKNGGYHRLVVKDRPRVRENKRTYSHAFVLLALATAMKSGISGLKKYLTEVYDTLEKHFWEADHHRQEGK